MTGGRDSYLERIVDVIRDVSPSRFDWREQDKSLDPPGVILLPLWKPKV
jgi:hypothetical protein